ncbi:unnamed protein product, partial [Staurois parvus]
MPYDEDLTTASKTYFTHSQEDFTTEGPEQSPQRMSVVPSKAKDLKFMSQHDTDADSPVTQTRQRAPDMTKSPD